MSNFQSGTFRTPYGDITVRNPGSFVIPNLQTYRQNKSGTRIVQLQGPALRSFRAAEARIATKRKPHILITGHGYRSYDQQRDLYYGPDNTDGRYADPDGSLHVEALAVDIDQGQSYLRRRAIRRALVAEGWHYPIAGEPWHASFYLSG